jgi:hypothetical protein
LPGNWAQVQFSFTIWQVCDLAHDLSGMINVLSSVQIL